MKRVQRFPTRQTRLREQALWDAALESARHEPNKYARLLRSAMLIGTFFCGFIVVVLTVGAIGFGTDAVEEYLGSNDFLYGVLLRGLILGAFFLFAGYVAAGLFGDSEYW